MKISVISSYAWIHIANNYGALFQYYALQKYLSQRGHKCSWIRTILPEPNFIIKFINKLRQYKSISLVISYYTCRKKFMSFVAAQLNLSPIIYKNMKELRDFRPISDFYITGSDQVWGSVLEENYLTFVPEDNKKIAYAASFGKNEITKEHAETIYPWIRNFKAISVRESTGVEICRKMGVIAEHLLDPTLLLSASDYPSIRIKDKFVPFYFCYFLNIKNKDDVYFEFILKFCKSSFYKLKISAVQGAEVFFNKKYLVTASPQEWLAYYRYATGIFTNTFHGTVFALIYHKPFIVILQNGDSSVQNCRLYSLLEMFELEDRIYRKGENMAEKMNKPINWDRCEEIRNKWKEKTSIFFDKISL